MDILTILKLTDNGEEILKIHPGQLFMDDPLSKSLNNYVES